MARPHVPVRERGRQAHRGTLFSGMSGMPPPPGRRFTTITAGHDHTCAVHENSEWVCWGRIRPSG